MGARDVVTRGFIAPGFEPVADALAALLDGHAGHDAPLGNAFAVIVDGTTVVDLACGDAAAGTPWTSDTIAPVFSCTKGWLGTALLMLADRGQVDLDAPASRYWPAFGSGMKAGLTVRQLASHQARMPGIWSPITCDEMRDDVAMEELLAAQDCSEDPRAASIYHAVTIGWLIGGLIRRIDGRSAGQFIADEIARPLHADLFLGLPPAERGRVASVHRSADWAPWDDTTTDALNIATWGNPPTFAGDEDGTFFWNREDTQAAEIPGAGGIASAMGMARLYACLACGGELGGVRLMSTATLADGTREIHRFHDPLADETMVAGVGFRLQEPERVLGPFDDGFGHPGAGGAIAGAWPSLRTGWGYVTSDLRPGVGGARTRPLLDVVAQCIGAQA